MTGYNKFPGPDSKIQVCVTDSRDNPEDQSCNQKVFSPLDHGDQVDFDHLMQNPMLTGASGFLQQIFGSVTDSGTPVLVLKNAGETGGVILGQTNTVRKGGNSTGSGNFPGASKLSELTSAERGVNVPPDIQEVEDNGAMIRKVKEKGKQHSLDLLDGLPLHGALFDMTGFRLPDIKNVPTAKQTNDQMMNPEMLQQMMGQIMSLGQMFQGLAGNKGAGGGGAGIGAGSLNNIVGTSTGSTVSYEYVPPGANTGAGGGEYGGGLGTNSIAAVDAPEGTPMYGIMQGLTPRMQSAVNSLSMLVQGLETQGGVAFMTGDVVHEETYLQNATELLSQVNSLDDLMNVMSRLQWDTTLFGRENLQNVVTEIETAWGTALQEVDYNGNITVTYSTEDSNAEMNFAKNMTSNTGSPALGFYEGDYVYSVNSTGASQTIPGATYSETGGAAAAAAGGTGAGKKSGQKAAQAAQQIASQVQGLLGQVEGLAQGMSQNMFGESAETVKEMWKRMTREQENDAKKMHEKLNQDEDTKKMSKIIEKNMKGGNPIDMQSGNFDENNLESVGSGGFSLGFGP